MSTAEIRRNILISQDLGNAKNWDAIINIDFVPDEMIVKQITYYRIGPAENLVGTVYTNLTNDMYLGSIFDTTNVAPNTTYTMNKPIRGMYNFKVLQFNGNLTTQEGQLYIMLEFVKYKK